MVWASISAKERRHGTDAVLDGLVERLEILCCKLFTYLSRRLMALAVHRLASNIANGDAVVENVGMAVPFEDDAAVWKNHRWIAQ